MPVVRHDDLQRAGAVPGFEPHDALGGFARRAAAFRRFDAVVDRIAQQMAEQRLEFLQNIAVHLRGLADDFEFHLLAERATHIAHHARKALDAVGKRPHSTASASS